MANPHEQSARGSPQESVFYERCWRCRCVVPNGLIRRRTIKTGYSHGTHIGTGAAVTSLDHYETVSLCGVCDDELETSARQRLDASYRRWSFWGRLVGCAYGTFALTGIGVSLLSSLGIMLAHAYFRILGRAILTMHGATMVAVLIGYPPPRYATPVMASWGIIWAGLICWQLWYPENRPWPFRRLGRKGAGSTVNQTSTASTTQQTIGGKPS